MKILGERKRQKKKRKKESNKWVTPVIVKVSELNDFVVRLS